MKKVLVVHNIITPHTSPVFRELAKKVDLTVFYCAVKEQNRTWNVVPKGFKYKVLPGFSMKLQGKDLFTNFINLTIFGEINKINPDVVILSGWDLLTYQLTYLYCKMNRIKVIIWSGSTKFEPSWRRNLSLPLVKVMVKNADALIAYGNRAKEYLLGLGASNNKIFISYNTTDISMYSKGCNKYKKELEKKKMGLSGKKIILFYGQLIERKGVDILIKAFGTVIQYMTNVSLLIVGSGPMKENLENLSKKLRISEIYFIDDPGDKKISKYYSIADIFVLPSREEVWGLVVNEAMACGLPVVVSEFAGSSRDLIKNGENGYIFKGGEVNDLANKLIMPLKNKSKLSEMGDSSRKLIQGFTPEKSVKSIYTAIMHSMK